MTMVKTDVWPEDFQQIVLDLLNLDQLPASLPVEVLPIEFHFDELIDNMTGWEWLDFDRCREFVEAMGRGVEFPPVIVCSRRGLLRDGYHRLFALKWRSINEYPMLVLNELFGEVTHANS